MRPGGPRPALLCSFVLLVGCGGPAEPVWAPDDLVARAVYRDPGPAKITLFTMRSTANDTGLHSGLMISASQRVIFDPAGTFKLRFTPERNDVHHGITPRALDVYTDYYARETVDLDIREVTVPPEVAEEALRLVQEYGAVPKAQCALAITGVLRQLPGFETIPRTYFPKPVMRAFGRLPGATHRIVTDDDADQNHGVLFQATQDWTEPPAEALTR